MAILMNEDSDWATEFNWIIELTEAVNSLTIKPMYTIIDYSPEPMIIFQLNGIRIMLKFDGYWFYRPLGQNEIGYRHLRMPNSPAILTLNEFLTGLCEHLS